MGVTINNKSTTKPLPQNGQQPKPPGAFALELALVKCGLSLRYDVTGQQRKIIYLPTLPWWLSIH